MGRWDVLFGNFATSGDWDDIFQNQRMEAGNAAVCLLERRSAVRESGTIMRVVLEGEMQACNEAAASRNTTPQSRDKTRHGT